MTTGYQWAKRTKTQQLIAEMSKPKRNKYNARKVELDGYVFDSQREAQVYGELKLRQKAGEINRLDVHPKYELTVNGVEVATYKPDFRYWPTNGAVKIVDVKSQPTAKKRDFILIRKLMRACHGIDVEVIA